MVVGQCSRKLRWFKCDCIHNTLGCSCWRSFPTNNTSNNNTYKLWCCQSLEYLVISDQQHLQQQHLYLMLLLEVIYILSHNLGFGPWLNKSTLNIMCHLIIDQLLYSQNYLRIVILASYCPLILICVLINLGLELIIVYPMVYPY